MLQGNQNNNKRVTVQFGLYCQLKSTYLIDLR